MGVQVPELPMTIYGNVTLNGSPAPDGLNVTAWDNGRLVGSTTTSGGSYSVVVCGVAGETCSAGDTISFQLAQLTTSQTAAFNTSTGGVLALNLAFTGTPVIAAATSATTATTASTTSTPISEYGNTVLVLLLTLAIAFGVLAKRHSIIKN
jgi:hypothetical protein